MNDAEKRARGLVVETEAYKKGFTANYSSVNPYPEGTEEHTDWDDGFRMMDWWNYISEEV